MPFREPVSTVNGIKLTTLPTMYDSGQPPALLLPEKRGIPLRIYEYLCNKRGIDNWIVAALIHEEKLYEDRRGNVVFVGYDKDNEPRFASVRGTMDGQQFRGDCLGSDKRYSFNVAASAHSERLFVYESAIDLMSHGTFENTATGDKDAWRRHSRLSLAGTSDTALPFFLNQHRAVKELVFCLDNDQAGREASYALAKKYADKGYSVMIEPPVKKDFNEDLQVLNELIVAEKTRARGDISL